MTSPEWVAGVLRYARMVLSRLALVSVFVLVVVACTEISEGSTTSAESTTTTQSTTTWSAPGVAVDEGRLAVIEDDGTIALLKPDGSDRVAITEPAGESIYTQPIWSPDSTLIAFGEVSEDGFAVRVEGADRDESLSIPVSNNPFFMHWSPDSEKTVIGVSKRNSPVGRQPVPWAVP